MAKLASSSSALALHFLRRLLCAHSSADPAAALCHAPEPETGHETSPRSPCIVARLMGLDAMPGAEAPAPMSLRRSRSASSAAAEGSPAVVRPSASLRERPAYLRRESDEFLLLSFSPDGHRGRDVREELEFLLAAAGGEMGPDGGAGEQRRRSNGRGRKLRFGGDEAGRRVFRRRKVLAAAECERDAQSTSPVSVLEAAQDESSATTTTTTSSSSSFSVEEVEHAEPPCCSATSDQAHTTLEQQNSRMKLLHADFDQNFQLDNDLTPARSSCHVSRCSDNREGRNKRVVNRAEVVTPDVAGIWQPICRLVEEDLKNMEWQTRDAAIVVAEIESGIFDQVICEMMDELMQGRSEAVRPLSLRSISKKQLCGKNFLQTRGAIGCY
ncbi:hypothetical protein U9M48_041748 [Paspalum notatum var. saurae]|uniref:DUF3741 domain-containing protein n=1 Tax=Paspalum notatum var. saurae TaxID=547442 RepID=A0AAQ3UTN4_PASNO